MVAKLFPLNQVMIELLYKLFLYHILKNIILTPAYNFLNDKKNLLSISVGLGSDVDWFWLLICFKQILVDNI